MRGARTSRYRCSSRWPRSKARAPWICTAESTTYWAVSVANSLAMAELLATETAQFVVDAAVQIHGARALQRGHPLEHLYREVRAPRIYEGASEIQRTIIARGLLRGSVSGPASEAPGQR